MYVFCLFVTRTPQFVYGAYRPTLLWCVSKDTIIRCGAWNSGDIPLPFSHLDFLPLLFVEFYMICWSYSPLGYYFASCSFDRTARIWNTEHVQPLRILAGHSCDVDVSYILYMSYVPVLIMYIIFVSILVLQVPPQR